MDHFAQFIRFLDLVYAQAPLFNEFQSLCFGDHTTRNGHRHLQGQGAHYLVAHLPFVRQAVGIYQRQLNLLILSKNKLPVNYITASVENGFELLKVIFHVFTKNLVF